MILKTKANEGVTFGSNLKNSGKIFEEKIVSYYLKSIQKAIGRP